MLETRVRCTAVAARQLYQRGENFCDGLEIKFTSLLGEIQHLVHQKQLGKMLLLVLLR